MVKVKMFLCACLCILAMLPTPAKGDFIEVRNTDPNNNHMLSDLIVYGDPNDPNQVKWILIPGSEFSSDDVNIPPKGQCMYYADFKITRYMVSEGYWAYWDITYFYNEGKTSVFEVNIVKPKKVGMIRDPDQQQTVVLAIDGAVAPGPPPEGTILAFVEGYNELMPGWFVGTDIDFETGEVSGAYTGDVEVFSTAFEVSILPSGIPTQWNIDFQGDENHNNTYGQTDPVAYVGPYLEEQFKDYWNIFEVPALSAPWPGPTNYVTNPSMDLADNEGNVGVGKSSLVKFSIVGDAYGWAGGAGDDPLTGDYLIILNSFGVTNDPLTWRITGLAPSTTYRLTYYHRDSVLGRGINFVANGVETTVSVPGLTVASALVTTDWGGRITGTADSDGYAEGNWSALTIATVAVTATNPHPANGATDVPLDVVLGWTPGDYAVTHDVYLGTDRDAVANANPGSPEHKGQLAYDADDYNPAGLEPGTIYYWKVDEVEADGMTKHAGEVWSFTTRDILVPVPIQRQALNPYPADGATDVALDGVVRWTSYLGAVSHDVYFGTDRDAVASANPGSPEYKGKLASDANDYNPGGLEPGTTYYWRIDELVPTVGELWIVCKGDVWSFTTADLTPSIVDNFESYPLGTFPSAGGWEIVWAGTGENYVTNAHSYSPTKSLQLWGRPSWASVAQKKFSTDAPVIGYEFAIRIDSIGTGGPGRVEHPGFFSREAYIWGAYYACVIFNHDTGKIEAEDGGILGDWEPGVWYQVKVVLDRSINTYDVWIDGQLRAEGLTTGRTDTDLIDALALISAHPGVKVYYDDVSVF